MSDKLKDNLIHFVTECRTRGIRDATIRERLLAAGWKPDDIDLAMVDAQSFDKIEKVGETLPKPKPAQETSQSTSQPSLGKKISVNTNQTPVKQSAAPSFKSPTNMTFQSIKPARSREPMVKSEKKRIRFHYQTFIWVILILSIIGGAARMVLVDKPLFGFSYYDWQWKRIAATPNTVIPTMNYKLTYRENKVGEGTVAILDGKDLQSKYLNLDASGELNASKDADALQFQSTLSGQLVENDKTADIQISSIFEDETLYLKARGDTQLLSEILKLRLKNYFENWLKIQSAGLSSTAGRPIVLTKLSGISRQNDSLLASYEATITPAYITQLKGNGYMLIARMLETANITVNIDLFSQNIHSISLDTKTANLSDTSSLIEQTYGSSIEIARDAKRLTDLRTITQALEKYYNKNKAFPGSDHGVAVGLEEYLPVYPEAPPAGKLCTDDYNAYWYESFSSVVKKPRDKTTPPKDRYKITSCLNNAIGETQAGILIWTSEKGLQPNQPCPQSGTICLKPENSDTTSANILNTSTMPLDAKLHLDIDFLNTGEVEAASIPKAIDIKNVEP